MLEALVLALSETELEEATVVAEVVVPVDSEELVGAVETLVVSPHPASNKLEAIKVRMTLDFLIKINPPTTNKERMVRFCW